MLHVTAGLQAQAGSKEDQWELTWTLLRHLRDLWRLRNQLFGLFVPQLAFEVFNVQGYFVADQAVLSLYAVGKLNGTVVDLGARTTCEEPCRHACMCTPCASGWSSWLGMCAFLCERWASRMAQWSIRGP